MMGLDVLHLPAVRPGNPKKFGNQEGTKSYFKRLPEFPGVTVSKNLNYGKSMGK